MPSITQYKEFQAPALKGFAEAVQETDYDRLAFVDEFIGDETVYSDTFAYDIVQNTQNIAAMIGLDGQKPVIDRSAVANKMGEIAHFGLQDVIPNGELYKLSQPRNGQERTSVVNKLLGRSQALLLAMRLRIRVEKMKALALGVNEYDANGVKVKFDYGVPDAHKVALAGAELWSADKDILGDLIKWANTYRTSNGHSPEAILTSRAVMNVLTSNKGLIAEAGRPTGVTRISEVEVNEVLNRYELPAIKVVNETEIMVRNVYTGKDEAVKIFPKNRIVFASKSEKAGNFLTGPNPDDNSFEPILVLNAYDYTEPVKRSVFEVSQSGFAVIEKPSLLFHADVLEA